MASKKPKLAPIQVFVRIRPLLEKDGPSAIKSCSRKEICIKGQMRSFTFDQVFDENASQVEVYKTVVSKTIKDIMNGYNCTIFAYGQTGTGKTHTILGNNGSTNNETFSWEQESQAGIIQRAAMHLYEELEELDQSIQYSVTVSFMEIYNEEIRDLLCDKELMPLRIYDDRSKLVHVQNLQEVTVHNPQDILRLLKKGCEKRQVASTLMNNHSSRSHAVFTISVSTVQTISVAGKISNIICGKLNLIDLAGSENSSKSGSKDQRARESSSINQSLLTLGRVIKALVENSSHIPYRESKLTRILQDSLGGKAKTSIIATISPGIRSVDETLNTLDYARNARNVTNCPTINLQTSANEAAILEELMKLKRDLFEAASAEGLYMDKENYEEMTKSLSQYKEEILMKHDAIRSLTEQVEDLIAQKEEWEKLLVSFEITRQKYQEIKNENLINKNKMQNDNLLINYYETESGKLHDYVNKMTQRENHLHQKVDSLYAASLKNHTVIGRIIQVIEKNMDELISKDTVNRQEVTQTISRIIDFNNKVCRMFNNVKNELSTKYQRRLEVIECNNLSLQSDDPFSVHVVNLYESLSDIENHFNKYVNCCNERLNQIDQQAESIEKCRRDRELILRKFEDSIMSKVLEKERETKKLWDKLDDSTCDFSDRIEKQKDLDDFLDEEYNEILKERERLNEREQRYLSMRKMREEMSISNKMKEYTQIGQNIRSKICEFTDLKQSAGSICSATQNSRDIENGTFKSMQRPFIIQTPEEIGDLLNNIRNEIVKSVRCLLNKNSETADVLEQISSIFDVEGKTHLAELEQAVGTRLELVDKLCRKSTQNIRQMYNSSKEPILRTGDTPQRSDFQLPSHRSSRDSLVRRLEIEAAGTSSQQPDPE